MMKLLVFKMSNCEPCQKLTPILDQIKGIEMHTYMAEQDLPIFKQYRISGVPQILLLEEGVEQHRAKGLEPVTALLRSLELI